MIPRLLRVSVAVFALTSAVVCPARSAFAAAADSAATGPRHGFGGIGGQFGLSQMTAAGDYSDHAVERMSFTGNFRYYIARSVRWQVSPGFLWTAYEQSSVPAVFKDLNFPNDSTKDNNLTLVAPVTAQLQWVLRGRTFAWHVGAGGGVYRVWVENHRKVLKDPLSLRLHRGIYPGAVFEIGGERFFKSLSSTSVEVTAEGHYVFAKRDDQFPSGYNGTLTPVSLRIGANYYFDLARFRKAPAAGLPAQKRTK